MSGTIRLLAGTIAGVCLAFLCAAGAAGEDPDPADSPSLIERPALLAAAVASRFRPDAGVLRLAIYRDHAEVEAQDPNIPSHVDRFTYDGESFGTPEPVPVGRSQRRLNARLFPLANVDLRRLPALAADALARAQTEGGRVTHVLVERSDLYGESEALGRPLFRVHVEGPRGGAVVEYGLDGRKKHVIRW